MFAKWEEGVKSGVFISPLLLVLILTPYSLLINTLFEGDNSEYYFSPPFSVALIVFSLINISSSLSEDEEKCY